MVNTPSDTQGRFVLDAVLTACDAIGHALQSKQGFHLVVISSTVMPGAMDDVVRPRLEAASGKCCGEGWGLCYNPEFFALGRVLRDLRSPDFILIGESDLRSGEMLSTFYRRVCVNDPPVRRMRIVETELTKLAINTYVGVKITFANLMAALCERLPGADVDVVTTAMGSDRRIGAAYLKGALGYGGPCFPRDQRALIALARGLGVPAWMPEAVERYNDSLVTTLARHVYDLLPANGVVGIWGLAFKPDTDVITASPGVALAQALAAGGLPVLVYDPAAMARTREVLGGSVTYAESAPVVARSCDVLVVATPWPEFRRLDSAILAAPQRALTLLDCWRIVRRDCLPATVRYVPLGVGIDQ
jgi:UDPglucose 6-dehydrogenase